MSRKAEELLQDLKPLKNGKVVKIPKYTFQLNKTVNELNSMTASELKATVKELSRQANINLTYLKKAGYESLWKKTFPKNRITPSDDVRTLRKQYNDLNRFLNSQTSTVRGLKKYQRKTEKLLGIKHKLKPSEFDTLGRVMSRMHELGLFSQWYDSNQTMSDIGKAFELGIDDIDDIMELLEKNSNENYLRFINEYD